MRFVLAAALIVDAIAGHLLYRSAFATPNGRQTVLGATIFALLVAGVAVKVVRRPNELALSLARGIAVVTVVGLAGVGLLFLLAANFESGIPGKDQAEMLGLMLVALTVQVTIFVAARSVDGRGLVEDRFGDQRGFQILVRRDRTRPGSVPVRGPDPLAPS